MPITPEAREFSRRLLEHATDDLEAFAEAEILSGVPFIFSSDDDSARFRRYVAMSLETAEAETEVLIIGSARTGFSLDPDDYFVPFRPASDIDVVVVHTALFDDAWRKMLEWDYLTLRNRSEHERRWLRARQGNVWSGWLSPPGWDLRERDGIELSFPTTLKPLRDFSFRWFSTFRSMSRYRDHNEIPRHPVTARLYRTREHAAMYQAWGLRVLRSKLAAEPTTE